MMHVIRAIQDTVIFQLHLYHRNIVIQSMYSFLVYMLLIVYGVVCLECFTDIP